MSTVLEISFSPFSKGGKGNRLLRTDFTEAELAEIQATPERAAAFTALVSACAETEAGEAAVATATKDLSTRTRAFNDAKDALVNSKPKRSFMDEWRDTVKGKR